MKTPCFTLNYAAPEVLKQAVNTQSNLSDGYDEACDLWSLGVILYTMLSGRAPFQTYSREASAAAIMRRIRGGEFTFVGPQWSLVSEQAKDVIRGLLTVEPKKRLTMSELLSHPWVQGHLRGGYSSTPLMTPNILSSQSSLNKVVTQTALKATYDAFHMARREGFRLLDVSAAPLAQRRKVKKSSTDLRSSSSSGSSVTASKANSSSTSSSSASLRRTSSLNTPTKQSTDSVFNYAESKVKAYLSALPSGNDSPEAQLSLHNSYFDESHQLATQANSKNSNEENATSSKAEKRERDDSCIIIEERLNCALKSGEKQASLASDSSEKASKRSRINTILIE